MVALPRKWSQRGWTAGSNVGARTIVCSIQSFLFFRSVLMKGTSGLWNKKSRMRWPSVSFPDSVIGAIRLYTRSPKGRSLYWRDEGHAKRVGHSRGVARGGFPGFWNPPFGLWKWILSQGEKFIGTPLKKFRETRFSSLKKNKRKSKNIHYGRQIDISATIDLFARTHPRRLLLSDILAEWTVDINHNFIQHLMKYVIC